MSKYLSGNLVSLRLMTDEDIPTILQANHKPEIEQLSGGIYPMYEEELKDFYENERKDGALIFMIILNKTKKVIGEIGLHEIAQRNQTAEISIVIFDEKNHKKGYGTDALRILENYAFEILNLRKLIAWIYNPNNASIKLFEKLGFEYSGKHKAHRIYRGKYEDSLIYEKFRSALYENILGEDLSINNYYNHGIPYDLTKTVIPRTRVRNTCILEGEQDFREIGRITSGR